jgi:hypothetical protein
VKVVGDYVNNWKLGVTEWRTGAMTAIGARHLARKGARVLDHVGAHGTAFADVTLLDRVLDLEEIRVTSARAQSRAAFGEGLERALGKPVRGAAARRRSHSRDPAQSPRWRRTSAPPSTGRCPPSAWSASGRSWESRCRSDALPPV